MGFDSLAVEAAFNVCLAMTKRGVPRIEARRGFARYLGPAPIRKVGDNGPGQHGIPEIGAREKAFHDIVMGGGNETLKMLKDLVDQLYTEGRGFDSIDPYRFDEPLEQWKNRAIIELATHPLQAFLLGQLFATELAKKPVMRPLQPDDRKAVEFLQHYAFSEISSKFDQLKGDIRHEVIAGVESGENPREVARRLANTMRDYETDFGTIAITEVARAESQGRLKEFLDQGIEYTEGSSAHDTRVCDDCRRLIDGQTYRVRDIIGNSNYGRKKDDWVPCIPLHPRCVVGGAEVLTPHGRKRIELIRPGEYVFTHAGRFRRVLATSRRQHSGVVFDIGRLRVTGNHPILTSEGFREASSLSDCSDLVGVSRIAWDQIRAYDSYDSPTQGRKNSLLYFILSDFFWRRVPASAVYFYGEHGVWNSEVDIKLIDRILWNKIFASCIECVAEEQLKSRHFSVILNALRSLSQLIESMNASARSVMRGLDLSSPLLAAHAGPLHGFSFGPSAYRESKRLEPSRQGQARAASLAMQLLDGFSRDVFSMPRANPSLIGASTTPLIRSERISSSLFSGHVYDLQVIEDESFIAEGVAVHNCRCVWLPSDG